MCILFSSANCHVRQLSCGFVIIFEIKNVAKTLNIIFINSTDIPYLTARGSGPGGFCVGMEDFPYSI